MMAGYGGKNALSPKQLSEMHPALIGGGERAAAGLPPTPEAAAAQEGKILTPNGLITANSLTGSQGSASAANVLTMGRQPAPGAIVNALTGQLAPPPPPPPMQPASMPAAPAARPGQETSTAIGNAIALHKLPKDILDAWAGRYEYMRNLLGNLVRKPDLTHADLVAAVGKAVADKAMASSEAANAIKQYSTDPVKLRQELQARYMVAMHGLVHFAAEQKKRGGSAAPEGRS